MVEHLRKVWTLLTPKDKRNLGKVLAVLIVAAALEALGVGSIFPFLSVLTDPAVVHENQWLRMAYVWTGVSSVRDFLFILGGAFLAVVVLAQAVTVLSRWMQALFLNNLQHSFSVRLLELYLARPYAKFIERNTADVGRNVLQEGNRIVGGILSPTLRLASRGLVAISVLAVLLWVDPLATLVVVVLLGASYSAIYIYTRRRIRKIGKERYDANEARYKLVLEAFGGAQQTKLSGREHYFVDRYRGPSKVIAMNAAKKTLYAALPNHFLRAMTFGGLVLILLLLMAQGAPLTRIVPVMGVFALGGYRMMPALQRVIVAVTAFQYNQDVFEDLFEDLTTGDPPQEKEVDPLPFEDRITVDGVGFKYRDASDKVLHDIDLEIPKNTAVAFVGSTGSGKTTLVNLLTGLLTPDEGRISVDGQELGDDRIPNWQRNIGYVPQDIFLLDDTVRRNIAFGIPDDEIDDQSVIKAAKAAHIHEFIASDLQDGYDTVIGERGIRLSGGQRQRVGIARALYHDPEVLVLDEATSDIDTITETHIREAIEDLSGEKTLIIVAHRLSTIRTVDTIYIMEQGSIVRRGTWDELVETSKRFQALAKELKQTA